MRVLNVLLALLLLGLPGLAQTPSPAASGSPHRVRHRRVPAWETYVALTPQERKQIRPMRSELRQQSRSLRSQEMHQVQSILTTSQFVVFKTMRARARASRQRLPRGWQQSLGLTADQVNRLKDVGRQRRQAMRAAQTRFFAQVKPVLTQSQQGRLDEFLQSRRRRG